MGKTKTQSLVLDEALASVIVAGVLNTLKTMFGVKAKALPTRLEERPEISGQISGIVGMSQEKKEGILIVSFQKQVIFHILSKLYKKDFSEIDRHVKDGVGEITNIVYGSLKKKLNDDGAVFKQAIPMVIVEGEYSITSLSKGKSLIIPFETEAGIFNVEIALHS